MPKPTKAQLLVLLLTAVLCFGGGAQYGRYQQGRAQAAAALLSPLAETPAPVSAAPADEAPAPPPKLAVHVKGAVEKPGLYELAPGSRVADALELAGLLAEANTDIINLAAPLADGAEVVAPFRVEGEETDWQALAAEAGAKPAGADNAAAGINGLVNINSAGLPALQSLNGIGPAKAQAIIDYRDQHGAFQKVEDIKKVSGIGQATYDKIKDHICVE